MEQERPKLQRQLEGTRDRLRRLREILQDQVEFDIEDTDPDIYEREKTLALIKSRRERPNRSSAPWRHWTKDFVASVNAVAKTTIRPAWKSYPRPPCALVARPRWRG